MAISKDLSWAQPLLNATPRKSPGIDGHKKSPRGSNLLLLVKGQVGKPEVFGVVKLSRCSVYVTIPQTVARQVQV